jgi:cytidine deaminase
LFRHGAVIAKGGCVIAKGVNVEKAKTPSSSFSVHAEIAPLKRVLSALIRQGRTEQFEIYVARVTPTGDTANSRPCHKCMAALRESGIIAMIHYTSDNGQWESIPI